ncbi:MAG: hypothetical protein M3157_03005 [Actinomycetota bacterium]|nr:hypothetical protein [Actinomycetota bacterium]
MSYLFPALIIGALLLCHGMLGFAHQTSCHGCYATDLPTDALPAYEHAAGGVSWHGGEDRAGGYASTEYFAVFLAQFAVAVLILLLGARGRHEAAVSRPYRSLPAPVFARLPRGPTPPFLQVFRR